MRTIRNGEGLQDFPASLAGVTIGSRWVLAQFVVLVLIAVAIALTGSEPQIGSTLVAIVLFLIGQGMAVAAAIQMRQYISAHPAPAPGASLLQNGIYSLVRHPMYGGVMLMAAAVSVFDRNVVAVLLTVGLTGLFFGKSRYEESLLRDVFLGYPEYANRVQRRFIPWVL